MSEVEAVKENEPKTYTEDEVKALLEQETSGLKSKVSELLGETKTEREKRQELERMQTEAEETRQKEKGEFKQLYEKTQAELEAERDTARKFRQTIQQKELESATGALVSELTRDNKRAELLRKEALAFAQYTDNGVRYEVGGVEIEPAKLMEKLRADYPFLVDGSGASGGGATGGSKNGGAVTQGDFGGDRKARQAAIKQKFNLE